MRLSLQKWQGQLHMSTRVVPQALADLESWDWPRCLQEPAARPALDPGLVDFDCGLWMQLSLELRQAAEVDPLLTSGKRLDIRQHVSG